jgi:hypothetical protein
LPGVLPAIDFLDFRPDIVGFEDERFVSVPDPWVQGVPTVEIMDFVDVAPLAVIGKKGITVVVACPGQTDESVALFFQDLCLYVFLLCLLKGVLVADAARSGDVLFTALALGGFHA